MGQFCILENTCELRTTCRVFLKLGKQEMNMRLIGTMSNLSISIKHTNWLKFLKNERRNSNGDKNNLEIFTGIGAVSKFSEREMDSIRTLCG